MGEILKKSKGNHTGSLQPEPEMTTPAAIRRKCSQYQNMGVGVHHQKYIYFHIPHKDMAVQLSSGVSVRYKKKEVLTFYLLV